MQMVVLEMGANALRSEQSGCSGAFALFCSFPDGLAGSHGERTIACVAQHVFLPKKKNTRNGHIRCFISYSTCSEGGTYM